MQLDVDLERTFRITYMKYTDKQKDITMKQFQTPICIILRVIGYKAA